MYHGDPHWLQSLILRREILHQKNKDLREVLKNMISFLSDNSESDFPVEKHLYIYIF